MDDYYCMVLVELRVTRLYNINTICPIYRNKFDSWSDQVDFLSCNGIKYKIIESASFFFFPFFFFAI